MCPEKELISVYYDGELPEPFGIKLKAHLDVCHNCRSVLESFKTISERFKSDAVDKKRLDEAKLRVSSRLELLPTPKTEGSSFRNNYVYHNFWRRRIDIPVSAVAAACIVIIAGFFLLFTGTFYDRNRSGQIPVASGRGAEDTLISFPDDFQSSDNIPVAQNISNMNDILRFLEDEGDSNIVIIKLPETKNFNRYGEPRFLNASDRLRKGAE